MGVRKKPMRVYSVVKYAAIACGDAEVFMKFAQSRYKEKIWAHAAGVVIVEEAGGVVTDAGGRNLDFSKGVYLEGLDRGIIACSGQVLHDKFIGAVNCMFATMHHMYVCYNASREEESKVCLLQCITCTFATIHCSYATGWGFSSLFRDWFSPS
ncbi:PAP-specific phosphatase HAL2-like [Raphanus sativus]|nr:PAP-specific phosphatase HAL2-like [Raphanus sativus]